MSLSNIDMNVLTLRPKMNSTLFSTRSLILRFWVPLYYLKTDNQRSAKGINTRFKRNQFSMQYIIHATFLLYTALYTHKLVFLLVEISEANLLEWQPHPKILWNGIMDISHMFQHASFCTYQHLCICHFNVRSKQHGSNTERERTILMKW